MNQESEGVNSPKQSRKLEDYLNGHEEARTYYRELAQALKVFEKAAMLNPPPGLVADIMARVEGRTKSRQTTDSPAERKGLPASCRDMFRRRLQPAYAFTFIAGLMIGLILFAGSDRLTSGHGPELSEYLRGTANHRSWDLDPGSETSEGTLAYPGLSGRYNAQRDGPDLRLHLELSSTKPVVIKFRPGPHTALQLYSSDNPAPSTLSVSNSLVELSHRNDGSYNLIFRQDMDKQEPITMLVFSEGRLIHTETLDDAKR